MCRIYGPPLRRDTKNMSTASVKVTQTEIMLCNCLSFHSKWLSNNFTEQLARLVSCCRAKACGGPPPVSGCLSELFSQRRPLNPLRPKRAGGLPPPGFRPQRPLQCWFRLLHGGGYFTGSERRSRHPSHIRERFLGDRRGEEKERSFQLSLKGTEHAEEIPSHPHPARSLATSHRYHSNYDYMHPAVNHRRINT